METDTIEAETISFRQSGRMAYEAFNNALLELATAEIRAYALPGLPWDELHPIAQAAWSIAAGKVLGNDRARKKYNAMVGKVD